MSDWVFFKDQFCKESEARVSISDRAFRFGDGIFETMLVHQKKIFDFTCHSERIKNGLEYYWIKLDTSELEKICHQLIEKNNLTDGYIRIIISRGENPAGAIGYLAKKTQPYMIVQSFAKELPEYKKLRLSISSFPATQDRPAKTLSSLDYSMSMLEAERKGFDNALILNKENKICETASGNIFWIKNNKIYTPSTKLPLIPGTVRKKIIEAYQVIEGVFDVSELKDADEIFMTNIGTLVAGISEIGSIYKSKSFDASQKIYDELINKIKLK